MTAPRRALSVLMPLALLALGPNCPGGSSAPIVSFDPQSIELAPGGWTTVDVVARLKGEALQAFDFDAAGPGPGTFLVLGATPHAEFDDDGRLFVDPETDLASGRVRGVVDLRHGPEAAEGEVRIARLTLFGVGEGEWTLSLPELGLARPDGSEIEAVAVPVTVRVQSAP